MTKKQKDAAAQERKFLQLMYSQEKRRADKQWQSVLKELAEDASRKEI